MGKLRISAAALVAATALAAGTAAAQGVDRGTSVTEREQATAAALGVHLGSFTVNPVVALDGRHDDNIFATDRDRRGDFYLTVRPELSLRSDFAHDALDAHAYFDRDIHARYGSEDVTQFGGDADGRYDLAADTSLSARIAADRLAESRASLDAFRQTAKPARYTSLEGEATLSQAFGSLALAAAGRVRKLSYADVDIGGATVDQRYRDLTIADGTLTATYGLHERMRFVVQANVERRRYALRPGDAGFDPVTATDRSADGYRIEAGVEREITSLVTGTIRIGYLRYDYTDPRLRDIAGFSYSGDLRWNVTGLTTITASATRRLDETTSPVTAGNLRDEFRLGVDHELLRRLVLAADARYASIRPSSLFADSTEFELGLGARYYVGHDLRVTGEFRHSERDSRDRSIAFRSNIVLIGLRLAR